MKGNYLKLFYTNYRKIFMTGDLHGCYDLLMQKLKEIEFNFNTDLLICTGDLIDRGTQNIECLKLIKEPWFKCVLGNHEQLAINSIEGLQQSLYAWLYNGGDWYFKLSGKEQEQVDLRIKECKNLPLVIELRTQNGKWCFAHADYPHKHYNSNKTLPLKDVIWGRKRIEENDQSPILGVHTFVFGHTPHENIHKVANRLYIDTGAVFTGNLIVTEIPLYKSMKTIK